jgi:integrase
VQRWLCRDCAYRFSKTNNGTCLKQYEFRKQQARTGEEQNEATVTLERMLLTALESQSQIRQAGATTTPIDPTMKGKIIEHAIWMKKEGYAEQTITRRIRLLTTLVKRGANLFDPESTKTTIAEQQKWSLRTKEVAVETYSCLLKMMKATWEPPHYRPVRKLPFIPTEQEINQLIAGCNKKTSTFLQLLKETGARCGEAWQLTRIDINPENRTVNITPEKGSEPRMLKISDKLTAMLNSLPNNQPQVFQGKYKSFVRGFRLQRNKIARKLENERIHKITFHTFRHWKATMEYAKTKDILHVMKMLGHKNIQNTLLYTQLISFENDDFHSATAKTVQEIQKLVEAGFEYVCETDEVKIFRKRK